MGSANASKKVSQPEFESAERAIRWLNSTEAIAALGAKFRRQKLKKYQRIVSRAEAEGCSWTRIDAAKTGGEPVFVAGMKRGRGLVRFGDSVATPRWTPPQNVALEDYLDRLSVVEACMHSNALSSVTGRQLFELRARKGSVETQRTRMKSLKADKDEAGDPVNNFENLRKMKYGRKRG